MVTQPKPSNWQISHQSIFEKHHLHMTVWCRSDTINLQFESWAWNISTQQQTIWWYHLINFGHCGTWAPWCKSTIEFHCFIIPFSNENCGRRRSEWDITYNWNWYESWLGTNMTMQLWFGRALLYVPVTTLNFSITTLDISITSLTSVLNYQFDNCT